MSQRTSWLVVQSSSILVDCANFCRFRLENGIFHSVCTFFSIFIWYFCSFDTPESGGVVVTTVGALNPRIVENVYGDDKENLDVDAIVVLEDCKKVEP